MPSFWLISAFLWTAGVLALALSSPRDSAWFLKTFGDKVLHGIAFTVGCLVWGMAAQGITRIKKFAPYVGAVIALFVGAMIELLQFFTPNRSPELADLIADIIGILPALLILLYFRPRRENSPQTS